MDQDQEVAMNSRITEEHCSFQEDVPTIEYTPTEDNSLLEPDVEIMEGVSSPNRDETSDTLSKDSLIEDNTSLTRKGGSYKETLPFTTSEMTCL